MRAKFRVSSFNRSRDMEGSQNSKIRSRDPFTICKQGVIGYPYSIPRPRFPDSLYHFHGATERFEMSARWGAGGGFVLTVLGGSERFEVSTPCLGGGERLGTALLCGGGVYI